jgi:inner membrane protein
VDNVTHSLFGYALGRVCTRKLDRADPARARLERAVIFTSVLASNAPDLDLVTGFFGGDRQLTYLLEHRGYTHTFVFAIVMGLIVGLGCAFASRLSTARARLATGGVGIAACLLHVGFDFLNDYGVHPFFPFDNHWYYGDSVFIIEPLLLAVLVPLPALFARTLAGRASSASLAFGLLLLSWFTLPPLRAIGVTAVLIGAGVAQRRFGSTAIPALAASAAVVAAFAVGSRLAEAQVRDAVQRAAPTERVLDVSSVPVPANPTCFRALLITLDPAGMYRVRDARSQLFGPASACQLLPVQPTAPLTAADGSDAQPVHFDATFAAPAAQLDKLAAEHCDAAAMLRFIRVPFWLEREDGTILGDLRYDRAPQLEFTERQLNGKCSGGVPPWVPPRRDLLGDGD